MFTRKHAGGAAVIAIVMTTGLARAEGPNLGKPISQARGEMDSAAGLWEYAATLARHIYGDTYNTLGDDMVGLIFREPIGVVGMITPWNWPINQIACKVAPALAAGCTIVLKPTEIAPMNAIPTAWTHMPAKMRRLRPHRSDSAPVRS